MGGVNQGGYGVGGVVFMVAYLLSLLLVGYWGYLKRGEKTLSDFYLGGRGVGFFVLLFTLYATQYSGNTLFGLVGGAYREGWVWLQFVYIMMMVVVFYLLYAPKLYPLARREGFVTPSDYLEMRYESRVMSLAGSVVMLYALGNFMLAQMTAMGRAFEGVLGDWGMMETGANAGIGWTFLLGVVGLALVMLIYETLGGFRAVAWTDMIQGLVMLCGFGGVMVLIVWKFGGMGAVTERMMSGDMMDQLKVLPPGVSGNLRWMSYVLVAGIGASLYPQAIQRIYAAKQVAVLKKSLCVMVFLPLFTTLVMVVIGVYATDRYEGLSGASADKVFAVILGDIQGSGFVGYCLSVLLSGAVVAAIMSTADSALLTMSSMITKDFLGKYDLKEATLMRIGKVTAWVLVVLLGGGALLLEATDLDLTLIDLLDLKLEGLAQLAPAFMLGMHWKGLRSEGVLAGLIAGLAVMLALRVMLEDGRLFDVHAGLYGLAMNVCVAVGVSWILNRSNGRLVG
ncbi:Sodium/proline symporter [Poriferisphaera corsica]|uniref:Sodium/proline symporter n=1 Tax=Poriferisphaera corsica TaxID=2528020 RepID=A0A517YWL3_9BACT|nr:sodium:solute symporter family protein [Poriferisphaera corsica]QDU34616.1 Sodium/proline symporter [Poriferisphaera corsica]